MTPLARPRVGSARRQTLMSTYLDSNMKPTEEILQGAIYNATQTCRTSLSDCIQFETLMKNEWAENRLADFNLWASGVGASVKGKASLDARLATRPDARDVVANLLQVLTGAIEECKALVGGSAEASHTGDDGHSSSDQEEDPPRSLSPWSDDTESDPDLEAGLEDSSSPLGKAKETVNSILDLLVRIAITIRRSGTQSRLRKADRKFKIEDHEDLQRHLVVVMLSQGPFSSDYTFSTERTDASKITPIQWRLINCNLKRRNRFLYAQKHSDALDTPSSSTVPSSETPKPEIQDLPARPLGSTPVQKPSTKSVAMATSASGITDLPAVLPALPKGPVSSHATRTNLSTTVIKLPYPHPPKVDEDAMVFSCPCCCQTLPVAMLEMSRWKKHLAEDIQPYTCVLPGCPSPETLYVTKKEWDLHLREDHGSTDMWTCFACLDSLQLETEADFVAHTVQEHSETISQGQIHALAAACKKSITAEITSCPLCAWPTLEEGEVSQIAVLDHIAEHVHAFSLRALPWAPDAVHETEAAVEKAATKVEPWLTKRNFTSKTLTVIESSTTAPAPPLPPTHYFETHDYFAEDSDNSSRSTVSDGTIERELREEPPLLFEDSNNEVDIAEPNDEADESREEDEDSDNGDDTDSDNFVSENVFKLPEESEKESSGYVSRLQVWYSHQDTKPKQGHSNYARGDFIGCGTNSKVRKARYGYGPGYKLDSVEVAIKRVMKNKVKNKVEEIYQEIELLQYVRHPNIVTFVDWYESKDEFTIVTNLADGGNLFDYIVDQGRLTESKAQRALSEILAAVEYLHYHGIVHRHLAVHKFGYLTKNEGPRLILISLARADWESTEERSIIPMNPPITSSKDKYFGTFAPEIMIQERSGKPADMWSIGVIAYSILAGYSPFRSDSLDDLIEECTQAGIVFHERYWKDISNSAKDFILQLLRPKPEDRFTIMAAKSHPWITGKKKTRGRIEVLRFAVPPKQEECESESVVVPPKPEECDSESDDDDDMLKYFDTEIEKAEAELYKLSHLEKAKLPTHVMARYAALSLGAAVKIVEEDEGLLNMVKELPEAANRPQPGTVDESTPAEYEPLTI